jgi:hypothetical protein
MRLASLLVSMAVAGCSSSEGGGGGGASTRAGEIRGADVWKNDVVLTGSVVIAKDAVVEIAPGARVTCAAGASVVVMGTLKARASGSHARITCERWNGVRVESGGKLDLEGVELENPLNAGIAMVEGAGESRFVDGAIARSLKPLVLARGTKLTIDRVRITEIENVADDEIGISVVEGKLVATHLDYDALANEGISVKNGGELVLEDSTVHGKNGKDMVSAYGAKHLTVRYSTFRGAHCGIHIQPSDSFEIDHVTSEENIYGMTIYASGNGPNTVTSSNISGVVAWLDFQGDNGPITFDNVFTSGDIVMKGGPAPTIKKANAPVPDAKPRN